MSTSEVAHALLQQRLGAADFAGAGQEDQRRAGLGAQRALDRVGDLGFDARARIAAEITRLHRKAAAFALDHRRAGEQRGDAGAVDGRRHHQQLEVLAQALLRVAREREPEIGIQRPLVEFVEQHRGDAVERRIVEDQPREDAFGDDLDARALRHLGAEADAQAHRVADLLAQRRRHARGGGAGGEPARLEHEDLSCPSPTARRSAPAARAWSCRRPAAPPARRHRARASAAVSPGSAASMGSE